MIPYVRKEPIFLERGCTLFQENGTHHSLPSSTNHAFGNGSGNEYPDRSIENLWGEVVPVSCWVPSCT